MRKCCYYDFEVDYGDRDMVTIAKELAAMSDHLATHNPSPAQWSEAYSIIQRSRKRSGAPA